CTVDNLVRDTLALLENEETRQRQLDGFEVVADKLAIEGRSPSIRAAEEVLGTAGIDMVADRSVSP
ncbi:MAG: hypothetical protein K8F25_08400, partial [Fimbriimonadaceae bacterium]|nr:hypothetical protein [Alphaproteobacteria bacterium]